MRATRRVIVSPSGLNPSVQLPYGVTVEEIGRAIQQVYNIIHVIDSALIQSEANRLEDFMHPANFSFLLSELVVGGLARHCTRITKNRYHNRHPDLLPVEVYPGNSALRAEEGIEVKCSRHESGWQGHNAEDSWVLVGIYKLDTSTEPVINRTPTYFSRIMIARLDKSDWSFAGRREGGRRTPTASILKCGTQKLNAGTIYLQPDELLLEDVSIH